MEHLGFIEHVIEERVISERDGSPNKGMNLLKGGMEHLEVEWSILVHGCAIYNQEAAAYAWMCHLKVKVRHY